MNTFRRLLKYIISYKNSILIATLCAILIAICNMIYVSAIAESIDLIKIIGNNGFPADIFPFKNSFVRSITIINDWKIHLADSADAIRLVSISALFILFLFIIKGILSYAHTYITSKIGQKLIVKIQDEFYSKLVHLPLKFFSGKRAGDIMCRGVNDIGILQFSVNSLTDILQALSTILIFTIIMFAKNWQLTLLTGIVFPPTIYIINRFGKRVKRTSKNIQERLSDISSHLEWTISGSKIIKSFTAEDWEKKRSANNNKAKYVADMKRVRLVASRIPFVELISTIGLVTVFWFGFWQVITGRLTTGWFVGFLAMVGMVYRPIKTVAGFNSMFQQAIASAERIFEVMDNQPEIYDSPEAISIPRINGNIEFNNVSFAYNGKPVLNHINLKIKSGESIALVGPSGAGKTTFTNLIMRFYDVTQGEITIDGYPISRIALKSLRSQIGLVPQETILFSGTVMENIAYGCYGAKDDEIIQSAKNANAHEFISQLPYGYNTFIGEHGVQLSGGQRQRLSIARVILKNPRILILDEATSSLDTESELLVQNALANVMRNRTTFVIAHRLSSVINADRIIILNNGEIIGSGTHEQLYAQNELYRKLCNTNMIGSAR